MNPSSMTPVTASHGLMSMDPDVTGMGSRLCLSLACDLGQMLTWIQEIRGNTGVHLDMARCALGLSIDTPHTEAK